MTHLTPERIAFLEKQIADSGFNVSPATSIDFDCGLLPDGSANWQMFTVEDTVIGPDGTIWKVAGFTRQHGQVIIRGCGLSNGSIFGVCNPSDLRFPSQEVDLQHKDGLVSFRQ
jgi:hypothetical protein